MKKLTKCLIAILLLLSITVPTVVFAAEDSLTYYEEIITGKGDVNGDGSADNLDASLILKYDAGLIDSVEGGDINGDGKVDNLDAMFVLKYDAGIPNINIQVPNSVDFKWSYVSTCCELENEFRGKYIVDSTEELTALYNEYFGALSEYNSEFNEAIARYNEAFFAEKSLIIIGIGGHSSSVSYTVTGLEVQCEGNSEVSEVVALKATISVLYPMMQNADVATANIIIEFDKEYTVDQSELYVSYDVTSTEYLSKGYDWEYEYTYVPTQYSEEADFLSDRVINTAEELTEFYEEYKELCKFDTAHGYNAISFKDAIAGYDKAFFDRRYLIMLPIGGHSSSETFSVDEIQAWRSGYSFEGELKALNIEIAVDSPLLQTTDLVAGHIIIEINKPYEVDESKLVVKTNYLREEDAVP